MDAIARLTDLQIRRLYFAPARRRAKAIKAEEDGPEGFGRPLRKPSRKALIRHLDGKDDDSPLPARAEYVAFGVAAMGGTAEHWAREWDQLAGGNDAAAETP